MKGLMMDYPLTTTSILEYSNRVFPHKEIVSKLADGTMFRYSFNEMYKRAKKLAEVLESQLNVQPGDRVATFSWNNHQHVELYYGIPGAGAVCHPLNIRLSADQIAFIVNHAEDKVIFIDASLVPLYEKIAPSTPYVHQYVVLNAPPDFHCNLPNVIDYENLLARAEGNYEWKEVNENDACAMCYTSGTTGEPKGVLYSHRSTYLHAMSILMPNVASISSTDKMLIIVPQFHVMAWGLPFACLLAGAEMVMPGPFLQPAPLIDILQKEKVTKAAAIPTIWLGVYQALKKDPPLEKLAITEYLVGGSAMPQSLLEGFEKDFGIKGVHAWGMTETSPLGTACRLQAVHDCLTEQEQYQIRATQGIVAPGVEMRLVTEDGSIAPSDGKTIGEIEVKGGWIIKSYYKSGDKSSFTNDGWFRTGDIGTMDPYGYMQICDRTKDVIKSGGEWISSIALETAIIGHPGIKEACVIAIPDEKWLERPLACIVINEESSVGCNELKAFLRKNFVSYQVPEKFVVLPEIPKTSVGKYNKKELRKMYAEGKLPGAMVD